MAHLGKQLSQMVKPELKLLAEELNLTDEESAIFAELAKGKSIVYIADRHNLSCSTVSNRIKAIRNKINRLERERG